MKIDCPSRFRLIQLIMVPLLQVSGRPLEFSLFFLICSNENRVLWEVGFLFVRGPLNRVRSACPTFHESAEDENAVHSEHRLLWRIFLLGGSQCG